MDFQRLAADVDKIMAKHYTKGRNGRKIEHVVLHYNYGDLTVEGCYDVWQAREASAHYQVESSGRVGQLVHDRDTARHAGDWNENCRSIGIEHANRGDSITDACLESGAHLTAAVCRAYGLGRPGWLVNVFPHRSFKSTSCPGPLKEGTSYHNRYMARAQQWYDAMVAGTEPPAAGATQAAQGGGAHEGTGFGGLYACRVDGLRVRTAPPSPASRWRSTRMASVCASTTGTPSSTASCGAATPGAPATSAISPWARRRASPRRTTTS